MADLSVTEKATIMVTSILITAAITLAAIFSAEVEKRDNDFKELREQAIERGFAQHNPITGEWEWIDAYRE